MKIILSFTVLYLVPCILYGQSSSTFGIGGGTVSGNNFSISSTLGQPLIGKTESGNISKKIGFWYETEEIVTAIEHVVKDIPSDYRLLQNYPNPFNPSTQIRFAIPEQAHVHLSVYNMLGQQVTTLVNENRCAGRYEVSFDASSLSSGLYLYRLQAGDFVKSRQMMLVK